MRKKQTEAAGHIRKLLDERKVEAASCRLNLPDGQQWVVFKRNGREVGVDRATGGWLRASAGDDWRCVALPITTSGAILAVGFLSKA
jgi:hypothetical protein